MKTKLLFLDGRLVKATSKMIAILAPGVIDGKGVFETMRLYRGEIFALDDHLTRLMKGLKVLKVRTSYSRRQLKQYLVQTIRANGFKNARLRLSLWSKGKRIWIAIVGELFQGYPREKYRQGFKGTISSIRRPKSRFSQVKSLDYACFLRALLEAKAKKYDEAILLNSRGQLVEGSRTNIFFVKEGVLYTPSTRCGCLPGITRRIVFHLARQMGIPCKTVTADVCALQKADEAFLTNSLMGVMPLTVIESKKIGSRGPGPTTKKFMNAYYTNAHSSCPPQVKSV